MGGQRFEPHEIAMVYVLSQYGWRHKHMARLLNIAPSRINNIVHKTQFTRDIRRRAQRASRSL